jgi:Cu/Zn superoxide dismutase
MYSKCVLLVALCVTTVANGQPAAAPATKSANDDASPTGGGSLSNAGQIEAAGGDAVKNYAEMQFKNTYFGCGYVANPPAATAGAGDAKCTAQGTMYIEELESGTTRMYGLFYNLIDGSAVKNKYWDTAISTFHAAHIHTNAPTDGGAATDGCNAIGEIWDGQQKQTDGTFKDTDVGFNHNHMGPYDQYRKLGDLGNVQITSVKQGGQSQFSLFDDIVTLEGHFSVEGMSMNIHYDPFGDDLGQYKPALTAASTAADITAEMGKMDVSMAAGLHDGATDGGLLNPIACGGIKKFTAAPTVQKTAHMELDMTVGGNSIHGTLTFEEIKMPAGSVLLVLVYP